MSKIRSWIRGSLLVALAIGLPAVSGASDFSVLVIKGTLPSRFNAVGLFDGGADRSANKLGIVSDGSYRITIDQYRDMNRYESAFGAYYMTDMRFWKDVDGDGYRDTDETNLSACHFIKKTTGDWFFTMSIYGGETYRLSRSTVVYSPE